MSEIVEKSVIGAILIDPKCVSEIYEQIEKNRQGILSTEVLRFDGDNMQFIETDESIKEAAKGFRKAEEPTPFD